MQADGNEEMKTPWFLDCYCRMGRDLDVGSGHRKSLEKILEHINELVASYVDIRKHAQVLNAGCGISTSALFLSQHYDCHVTGICLSEEHIKLARAEAQQKGRSAWVDFQLRDFCHTHFIDTSFDAVWGVESVCYGGKVDRFMCEAHRILKDDGQLIMAGCFAKKLSYSYSEAAEMQQWLSGMEADALANTEAVVELLTANKFASIVFHDISAEIMPTISAAMTGGLFLRLCQAQLGGWLGLYPKEMVASLQRSYHQYRTWQQGLWTYGVFVARKKGPGL